MFLTPDVLVVKEAHERFLPIDAMTRTPGVFGPKVEPPADADVQTGLLCVTGRSV